MASEEGLQSVRARSDLSGKVALITGGAGLLGVKHAEAIAEMGGVPIIADVREDGAMRVAEDLRERFGVGARALRLDITDPDEVASSLAEVASYCDGVDILINNAANNPRMARREGGEEEWSRLESFPLEVWNQDLQVGLTGAFLCSKVFGSHMAERGQGVIVNIASDLAIIAPDQRLYRQEGVPDHLQPVKPVTYSVVKGALVSLTRYLATYWAADNVRVNSISFGGVADGQPSEFVARLTNLIPLGRMAEPGEYKAAIVFLCSDASSYMTGANLVIDGGRTCW